MVRMILRSVFLCTALLLAACGGRVSQQSNDADVAIDLAAESMAVGSTVLEVTVTDGSSAPINDATLNVKGDMTHAGMTPVLVEGVSDGREGVYRVPFEWTMGGDWVVTVEAVLPDGRTVSQQFDLSVSGDMEGMDEE